VTAPNDIITATDPDAEGYDMAWAQALFIPTCANAAGEPYWLRDGLAPWQGEADA
jgi:hypothetical protein